MLINYMIIEKKEEKLILIINCIELVMLICIFDWKFYDEVI